MIANVALRMEVTKDQNIFLLSGRGELHLGVLMENMRREGYEFAISAPEVVVKEIDGKRCEPYEQLVLDVDENNQGAVVELIKCLQASDTELVLVDLVYDLLTDKALSVTQFLPDESVEPVSDTDSLTTVGAILEALAADTTTRRGLAEVLVLLLNEEYVVSVLGDVANVLEADLLDDFIKLAAAYATKSCE